jgi:ribosomal protein S18 acetylase RimI-like enzyme
MYGFKFIEGPIEVEDYLRLRDAAGWQELDYDKAEAALANSLYSVNAASSTEVVGCARVVGDGGAYYYIQDVLVIPELRGLGIAEQMMRLVMGYLKSEAAPGSFVGMMASGGIAGFYVDDGFSEQLPEIPGMFRIWRGPAGE